MFPKKKDGILIKAAARGELCNPINHNFEKTKLRLRYHAKDFKMYWKEKN